MVDAAQNQTSLPSVDDFIKSQSQDTAQQPTAQTGELPSVDEFINKDQAARQPSPFTTTAKYLLEPNVFKSETEANKDSDDFYKHTVIGRVANAFGQGYSSEFDDVKGHPENLGLSEESKDWMRKNGVFNDYAKGQNDFKKSAAEYFAYLTAGTADFAYRTFLAGPVQGTAEAVAQTGEEAQQTKAGKFVGAAELGRTVASMAQDPEFMMGAGMPHPLPESVARYRATNSIAVPESVYMGTAEATEAQKAAQSAAAQQVAAKYQAAATLTEDQQIADLKEKIASDPQKADVYQAQIDQLEAKQKVAAPEIAEKDIHDHAREINPDAINERDALEEKRANLREQIGDPEERRQAAEESAPHNDEIQDLQDKLETEKNKAEQRRIRAQIRDLTSKNEAAVAEAMKDTPDQAGARAELQKVDERRRDIAPDVAAAYREAETRMPKEEIAEKGPEQEIAQPEEKTGENKPEETTTPKTVIAEDYAKHATDAGRPAEEAKAAGTIAQAYYEQLARDVGNGKSAEQLYRENTPTIRNVEPRTKAEKPAEAATEKPSEEKAPAKSTIDQWKELLDARKAKKMAWYSDTGNTTKTGAVRAGRSTQSWSAGDVVDVGFTKDLAVVDSRTVRENGMGDYNPANPGEKGVETQHFLISKPNAEGISNLYSKIGHSGLFKEGTIPFAEARERMGAANEALKDVAQDLEQTKQGGYSIVKNAISLFKASDASTLMHEEMHGWLEQRMRYAKQEGTSQRLKDDMDSLRKWAGFPEGKPMTKAERSAYTRAHEKVADAWERYLYEGVAPSKALARVFSQFREWMSQLFNIATKQKFPINENVRSIFDRMLAENPEKTVIAPERQESKVLDDLHGTQAETTAPEQAAEVGNNIRSTVDRLSKNQEPELYDSLKENESQLRTQDSEGAAGNNTAVGGEAAASEGKAATIQQPSEVNPGGSEVAGKSPSAPQRPKLEDVYAKVPRKPLRLSDWVRKMGGIKDEGGDIRHVLGGENGKGLVRPNAGINADDMARKAWEAGYFVGTERPSMNDFLDKLTEDLKDNHQYSDKDHQALADYHSALDHNAQVDELADRYGIDIKGKSRQQFWDEVAEKQSVDQQAAEISSRESAFAENLAEAERLEKEFQESRGDSWEAAPEDKTRTLEDLENERQQEERTRSPQQGAEEAGGPEPAAVGQSGLQEGGGQRGRGAESPGSATEEGSGAAGQRPTDASGTIGRGESAFQDRAGNIRLDLITSNEDVANYLKEVAEQNNNFMDARRGVLTFDQQEQLSQLLDMKAGDLAGRKIGEAYNAEQIRGAIKLLAQSSDEAVKLAEKAATGSDADVLAAMEASERHRMIMEHFSGITAEAGRALGALRGVGQIAGIGKAGEIAELLQTMAGKSMAEIKNQLSLLSKLDSPGKVSKFIKDSAKPTFGDMALEYYQNALISGLNTHGSYVMGGTMLSAWKATAETAMASLYGKVFEAFGKEGGGVRLGEIPQQLKSFFTRLPSTISDAGRAIKTGQTLLLPGEEPKKFAFSPQGVTSYHVIDHANKTWRDVGGEVFSTIQGLKDSFMTTASLIAKGGVEDAPWLKVDRSKGGAIPNLSVKGVNVPVGGIVRVPQNMVAGFHTFLRSVNYGMEIAGQSFRAAANENLTGDALTTRMSELRQNPTDDMMKTARTTASDLTLMGQSGALTQKLNNFLNTDIYGVKPLRFMVPFTTVKMNEAREFLLRRTPLGVISPEIRADISGNNGAMARDFALARMTAGTLVVAALPLVFNITPSWTSSKDEAMRRRTGEQSGSIQIGDTMYDVSHLGVLGKLISLSANLHAIGAVADDEDHKKLEHAIMSTVSNAVVEGSFMQGLTNVGRATMDSDRYGPAFVKNFIASWVPQLASQAVKSIDPYEREAHTLGETLTSRVPFSSESLEPKVDIFGEPVPNRATFGIPGFSAIYESRISNDPVDRTLANLGMSPSKVKGDINGVKLTPQQHTEYATVSGVMIKHQLDEIIGNNPEFANYPHGVQIEMINEVIKAGREYGRAMVMQKYPEIPEQAADTKEKSLQ